MRLCNESGYEIVDIRSRDDLSVGEEMNHLNSLSIKNTTMHAVVACRVPTYLYKIALCPPIVHLRPHHLVGPLDWKMKIMTASNAWGVYANAKR